MAMLKKTYLGVFGRGFSKEVKCQVLNEFQRDLIP